MTDAEQLIQVSELILKKLMDSNMHKSIKDIRDEVQQELGMEAVATFTKWLGHVVYKKPESCQEQHPLTGDKCGGGKGHFGCHMPIWDPYKAENWWITPCKDNCDFHGNHGGNNRLEWEECIHCGSIKNLKTHGCAPLMYPIDSNGDLLTREDWIEQVEDTLLIDSDGHGYLATATMKSDIMIRPSNIRPIMNYGWPDWATHVMWYNI